MKPIIFATLTSIYFITVYGNFGYIEAATCNCICTGGTSSGSEVGGGPYPELRDAYPDYPLLECEEDPPGSRYCRAKNNLNAECIWHHRYGYCGPIGL